MPFLLHSTNESLGEAREGKEKLFVRISYESQNKKINDFMKSCSGVTEIHAGRSGRSASGDTDCSAFRNLNVFLLLAFTTFSSTAMADIA